MAENNSGMNAVIGIVAIIAILFVAYLAIQMIGNGAADTNGGAEVQLDLPGTDGDTNQ